MEPQRHGGAELHENELTELIIGAAIEVHRAFGPGLLESVYEECMVIELQMRGLQVERQKPLSLVYKGRRVAGHLRIDLVVEGRVVVELKTTEKLNAVHEAQLLTYLRLTDCRVGLLINFNVAVLRGGGIRRMVHGFDDSAPRRLSG